MKPHRQMEDRNYINFNFQMRAVSGVIETICSILAKEMDVSANEKELENYIRKSLTELK